MRLNFASEVRWPSLDRLCVGRVSFDGRDKLFIADSDAAELRVGLFEECGCLTCSAISQLKGFERLLSAAWYSLGMLHWTRLDVEV